MPFDINRLTKFLNNLDTTAQQIKKASENPIGAMGIVPTILQQFKELKIGVKELSANVRTVDESAKAKVQKAINSFLKTVDTAEENAGAVGAPFFQDMSFRDFKAELQRVKKELESKSRRAQESEKGGGL